MEIKTKTDTLLVATATPRYLLWGIPGLCMVSLTCLTFSDRWYLGAVFALCVSVFILIWIQWYKLTIDKQLGTLTVVRRGLLTPWPSKRIVPLQDIRTIRFDDIFTSSLATIRIHVKDAKDIGFGWSKEHYARPLIDAYRSSARSREKDIAREIEQFIGVEAIHTD